MPKQTGTEHIAFRASELEGEILSRTGLTDATTSPSQTAKRDLGRYYQLIRFAMPTITEEEANLLIDALNGTWLDFRAARYLPMELEDVTDALYTKWGAQKEAFLKVVNNWHHAQRLAIVDAVGRYWAGHTGQPSHEAALLAAGFRLENEDEIRQTALSKVVAPIWDVASETGDGHHLVRQIAPNQYRAELSLYGILGRLTPTGDEQWAAIRNEDGEILLNDLTLENAAHAALDYESEASRP